MNDVSVLAAQRAEDRRLCEALRSLNSLTPYSNGLATAANRVEQLSQELAEASHDRDRYHADCERLRESVRG